MPNFWFKFEWDAWRNDKQLRRCSKETRGFWVDCIAAMEDSETFFLEGTPEEICREVVADRGEFDRSLAELSRHGAATIEKCQSTVKIISRRLLKKINLTEYNKLKQREHRERLASSSGQDLPFKDLDSESLRVLDSSSIEEEVNSKPVKPDPKILLPADYKPPHEFWEWGHEHCKSIDLIDELSEFITFWREIATKNHKRTLRGWNATWKKRMKDLQEAALKTTARFNGNGKPKPPEVGKQTEPVINDLPDCSECNGRGRIFPNDDWKQSYACPSCSMKEKAA